MAKKREAKKEVSIFDELTSCIEDSYRTVCDREDDSVGYWSCCGEPFDHAKDCPALRAKEIVKELKANFG